MRIAPHFPRGARREHIDGRIADIAQGVSREARPRGARESGDEGDEGVRRLTAIDLANRIRTRVWGAKAGEKIDRSFINAVSIEPGPNDCASAQEIWRIRLCGSRIRATHSALPNEKA
ncbi:hypothetical protein [Burkholderia oklahomensis]|uniref:hypothetical protein n=1 Tax=Burkholderia oklahomensis TaxID=342113 RepID=UPI0004736A36|nr:hypothetical protein [Burkholderia oklahomensis]AJX34617.1 hypothetical protein BG90_5334 [Burkholderia oklahomensis C6786]AOI48991.1 hypothetical protein WI23_24620 [Burkholderia oklahomensis C6786]KUY61105.1 hypothetical protein WI23_12740 [Burkholderia oklahomensis C6786]MBI0362789.1 hypothetical protein [Burkholderia oklahomensis]SUY26896.1 Uncharacterised protein [Burkholderia oklahomensis]